MYSRQNAYGYYPPTGNGALQYQGSNGNSSFTYHPSHALGHKSAGASLPDVVIMRLLSYCDEVTLLESALVSRHWLMLSRRVLFSSYTIASGEDIRMLFKFLQSPDSTVHADYVSHLDVSFTSDNALPSTGPSSHQAPQSLSSPVKSSDIHQLLVQLGSIESLRADWIGARASSITRMSTSPVSPQPLPSFFSLPHIMQRLKHLEVRGGSWPFDSLLQAMMFMPKLASLSLENIHEPTNISSSLPPVPPNFQLQRLYVGRCTLSGESTAWLLSSSQHSLRHLTVNSIRRRPGGGSFNSVLNMVGQRLETLRVRNFTELSRWDADAFIAAGLGFCPNLTTLVVWCEPPRAGSPASLAGKSSSPTVTQSYMPSSSPLSSPRQYYHTQNLSNTPRQRASSSVSHYSTTSSPSPQTSSLTSPYTSELGLSLPSHDSGTAAPFSAIPGTSSSPSAQSAMSSALEGSMLPILASIIKQGWFPRLQRLVIPRRYIDVCPTRVECQTDLMLRGIALGGEWGAL